MDLLRSDIPSSDLGDENEDDVLDDKTCGGGTAPSDTCVGDGEGGGVGTDTDAIRSSGSSTLVGVGGGVGNG